MIDAIIFDFDGLILDTETHIFRALEELFTEHGAKLPLAEWAKCIGTSNHFNPFVYLESQIGRKLDHENLAALRQKKYQARMQNEKARPGVEDYLQSGRKLGLKVGLASSSHRDWVVKHLKQLGLFDHFMCIFTKEDVSRVKPDPALYQKALDSLGVTPSRAIAFEDSPNGALAAKRAGMHCVIVPNEITACLAFGEVDLRIKSMADMPLAEVIARLIPAVG